MRKFESLNKSDVELKDVIFKRYQNAVIEKGLSYQYQVMSGKSETIDDNTMLNLQVAAKLKKGEHDGRYDSDADLMRWLQAAANVLQLRNSKNLLRKTEYIVKILGKAQDKEGYINSYFKMNNPDKKFTDLTDSLELYTAGVLFEAACEYHQATGNQQVIDIASKFAELIVKKFGSESDKIHGYDGHQEIELALVKLYEVTRKAKYLKMAKYFLEVRGTEPSFFAEEWLAREGASIDTNWEKDSQSFPDDLTFWQAHKPVLEQDEPVGNAVRLMYMLAAMVDVARAYNEPEMIEQAKKLFYNVVDYQMYVTGAIGQNPDGGTFTCKYNLPNLGCGETTATIALINVAKRLLSVEADARFGEVIELALHNSVLASISPDAKRYFDTNPLEVQPEVLKATDSFFNVERQEWFYDGSCPTNLAVLLTSVQDLIYTQELDTLYVHQYISNKAKVDKMGIDVVLQTSPNLGRVKFTTTAQNKDQTDADSFAFRIPSYAKNIKVSVNRKSYKLFYEEKGYIYINFIAKGSVIDIDFGMVPQRIYVNTNSSDNAGKVAVKFGPYIYCLEGVDNGENLHSLVLPRKSRLNVKQLSDSVIGRNYFIFAKGKKEMPADSTKLYSSDAPIEEDVELKFIPYYKWANRGANEMRVWIREQ